MLFFYFNPEALILCRAASKQKPICQTNNRLHFCYFARACEHCINFFCTLLINMLMVWFVRVGRCVLKQTWQSFPFFLSLLWQQSFSENKIQWHLQVYGDDVPRTLTMVLKVLFFILYLYTIRVYLFRTICAMLINIFQKLFSYLIYNMNEYVMMRFDFSLRLI